MIKILHTSTTHAAMSGCILYVATTNIAVEHFPDLLVFDTALTKMYESRSFLYLIMNSSDGSDKDVSTVTIIWLPTATEYNTIMAIFFSYDT